MTKSKLNRYFMMTEGFLFITPLVCYLYISLQQSVLQGTFQEVLSLNPNMTILFLISMMNPYIAYLMRIMHKHLEEGKQHSACINMALLLLAQLLTMNLFYFMMLLTVFYKSCRYYQIPVVSMIKQNTFKQTLFDGGGSLLVVFISSISLFATIQLM